MMAYWGRVWPILIAMVLGCLVATSSGYPSGAPQGACPTLKPGHGTAQLTNSPYSIEVDSTVFKSGQPLKGQKIFHNDSVYHRITDSKKIY